MKKKLLLFTFLATMLVLVPVAFAQVQTSTTDQETQQTKEKNQLMESFKKSLTDLKKSRIELRTEKREQVLARVKKLAENRISNIIERYERIKTRIADMKVISESEKAGLTSKIDTEITKLQTQNTNVENAATIAEIKVIMAEVKLQVKNSNSIVKEIVESIHVTHLNDIATRLEKILVSLTERVEALKTAGKDVTAMEALETKAQENIDTARTKVTDGDMKAAKESLVAARLNLVDLLQKVNAAEGKTAEEGGE